ncbi:MAG: TIGR00375 family protein, partial [Peptococcales bacterium]
MPNFFVDLHIHIGSTFNSQPVKITASKKLTLSNIIHECIYRKGIDLIGIVDCASPGVLNDLETLLKQGKLYELPGGGLGFRDKLTIIPGVEMESLEINGGRGHFLSYFPTLSQVKEFSRFLALTVKNIHLSTQQSYLPANKLS